MDQGLATRITDGVGFSLGSREIKKYSTVGLSQELQTLPTFKALAEREPKKFDSAVVAAVSSIDRGSDMRTSLREVSDLLAAAISESYRYASDDALDEFLDLQLEILKRNMYEDPKATLMVIRQRSPRNTVPDFPAAADGRFVAALLRSPVDRSPSENPMDHVEELRQLIKQIAGERNLRELYYKIPEDRLSQIAACELMNDLLWAIKALPPDRRHLFVRLTSRMGITRDSAKGFGPPKETQKFENGSANLGPIGSLISK